jgi:protocatechuate 3,4-dioxygenase beta subunit
MVVTESLPATPSAIACDPQRNLTSANAEGPYYMPDAPFRFSLLQAGMPGVRLVISGQVMSRDCTPLPGAVLDFWQANSAGVYDNEGYTLRGRQRADAAGRYQLETVLPGEYPGRPPHIHVKVSAPGAPALTTQIYFAGQPGNDRDSLIEPSLVTTLTDEADGSLSARFDFVLAK